jgi:ADP-heptose:LPS heptosyltransferase
MNILYIKIGAIGDIIQSSAAIGLLSDFKLTWVVSNHYKQLVSNLNISDEIISIESKKLFHGNIYLRLLYLVYLALYIRIKSKNIDLIVVGHSDWRYKLLVILFPFTKKRYYNSKRKLPLQSRNRIFEYYTLLTGKEEAVKIDLAQSMYKIGQKLISRYVKGACEIPYDTIVLVPGGSKNLIREDALRRWPVENYASLASMLIELNYKVVVIGSCQDIWVLNHFRDLKIINLVNQIDLVELVTLFNRSKLVITHDTGPLHLASTTHTNIIAIFGPTAPNAVVPFNNKNIKILSFGNMVACSPCYDGKNYATCSRAACMDAITPSYVFSEAIKILGKERL